MQFQNLERFKSFLDENIKFQYYDFQACLKELVKGMEECGWEMYELAPWNTKSRRPETIKFEREDHFFQDGIEVSVHDNWDDCETTVIF